MIEHAQHQLTLPIVDRATKDLVNAEDISTAWNGLPFSEQRGFIKALFDGGITSAPQRTAEEAFQPERVVITARDAGGFRCPAPQFGCACWQTRCEHPSS
ncbi:hypothetical protein [Kocuria massiliensis]|uniref:hypothetical protein n=1 Tax=Kocuria massiliensis TaxID=1926282 RepID=UPI0022B9C668|nr:hypothetical protein [Kocuria massiliensis]